MTSSSSATALLSAVKQGDYAETKKVLSEHGLPIDDDKWNDYKILIHAVHKGYTEIVKLLLSHGCRVKSSKSNSCKTPLCYAVSGWNLEMIKILLKAGASITDKDSNTETPLYMAMNIKFFTAVDLMLTNYNIGDVQTSMDEIKHFHVACTRNNVNLVESFIRCGMNVNACVNFDGYSPLHFAVEHECVQVVKLLLSYGADYTFLNAEKKSPLHVAHHLENSKNKYEMMDQIIFLHGTNAANPVDDRGVSHFHIACTRPNKQAVINFLNSGVIINSPTLDGCYPLHFAVESNCEEIVEILLKYGANVNVQFDNSTPLHIAIDNKFLKIAKLLLTHGANVCAKDQNDCTPIHKAYYDLLSHHEIFISIMSMHQGKMMNITDKYGMSIFHIACAVGDTTAVEHFLQRNVDINACVLDTGEFSGFTGLHFAAINFHQDVVKLLLSHGAYVNAVDKNGRLPIWIAATQFIISESTVLKLNENLLNGKSSYKEAGVTEQQVMNFMFKEMTKIPIVKLLVEYKSNLNRVNKSGILLLCKAYNPDVMWKVKGHVHNKNLIESICKTYNFACRKQVLEILIKNGVGFYVLDKNHNSILHLIAADPAKSNENVEIVKILMITGCNPNIINREGKTALHMAAQNGSLQYVQLFLQYKANPNCADKTSSTPLHYAAQKSLINDFNVETPHTTIMQLLIDNVADVDAKNQDGCTPLFRAVRRKETIKALLCLLKANCQVNIHNNQEISPLLLAARKKNSFAVKILLDYGADINLSCKNKCGLLKGIVSKFDALDFFDGSFMETFKVLEMHIEKLRLIDYPVSVSDLIYRKNLGIMLTHNVFTDILDVFAEKEEKEFDSVNYNLPEEDNFITPVLQAELERMKAAKIDVYTSLYDILFKDQVQMVKHVKNEIFIEYFDILNVEFPHYRFVLKLKYKQGMERYVLLEPAKESLDQLLGQELPDLCLDGLFVYLSNADLKSLSDVCD